MPRPCAKITYNGIEDHVFSAFKGKSVAPVDNTVVSLSLAELKTELKGDCYLYKSDGVVAGKHFGPPGADKHYIGGSVIRSLFTTPFVWSMFSQMDSDPFMSFAGAIIVPSLLVYSDIYGKRGYDHVFDMGGESGAKPVERINFIYNKVIREENKKLIEGKLKTITRYH